MSMSACHSTCAVAVGWTDLMFLSFMAEIMAAMKSHCASMIVGPLERAVGAVDVSVRGIVRLFREGSYEGSEEGRESLPWGV